MGDGDNGDNGDNNGDNNGDRRVMVIGTDMPGGVVSVPRKRQCDARA